MRLLGQWGESNVSAVYKLAGALGIDGHAGAVSSLAEALVHPARNGPAPSLAAFVADLA
jgi:hypothetical protein